MLRENGWGKAVSLSDCLGDNAPITHVGRTWEGQAGLGEVKTKSSILNTINLGCLLHVKAETKG